MERLGAPGAGLAIALENLFPPIPSELILPLAGFTAAQGGFSVVAAIVWTTAGSLAGALTLYAAGALLGRDRVYAIWARIPLTRHEDLVRTEAWFARHGTKAVLLGRFLPIFRSLVSVPAGLTRMPLAGFTALTLAGSAVWNTVFVLAGYLLGEEWHRVEPVVGVLQWLVLAAVALALGWVVTRRLRALSRR